MDAIIRGSRWPADGSVARVSVDNDSAWPDAYGAGLTPSLILSRARRGGTPDLTVSASTVSVSGSTLTTTVSITAIQTASLPRAASYYAALKVGNDVFPISDPALITVADAPGQG